MNKELYIKRSKLFREVLKKERMHHKLSQKSLALMLSIEQSYVSKTEIGNRRMDVIELLEYCDAMGVTLTEFVFKMEGRLLAEGLISPARKEEYLRWYSIYCDYYKDPPASI